MTTICVDLEERKLYTDSRCSWEPVSDGVINHTKALLGLDHKRDLIAEDTFTKVWRVTQDNRVYTAAGNVSEINNFLVYRLKGKPHHKYLKASVVLEIWCEENPRVIKHTNKGIKDISDIPFITLGSGSKVFDLLKRQTEYDILTIMDKVKEEDQYTGGWTCVMDISEPIN